MDQIHAALDSNIQLALALFGIAMFSAGLMLGTSWKAVLAFGAGVQVGRRQMGEIILSELRQGGAL